MFVLLLTRLVLNGQHLASALFDFYFKSERAKTRPKLIKSYSSTTRVNKFSFRSSFDWKVAVPDPHLEIGGGGGGAPQFPGPPPFAAPGGGGGGGGRSPQFPGPSPVSATEVDVTYSIPPPPNPSSFLQYSSYDHIWKTSVISGKITWIV